jgi:hypothetical protein
MNSTAALVLAGVAACVLAGGIAWMVLRARVSPAEHERRRRMGVNERGRMADASITDLQGDDLFYTYLVRGVSYAASQDVSALRAMLPQDPQTLFGPATVKYLPHNPADSIVVCEDWSGLRMRSTANLKSPERSES